MRRRVLLAAAGAAVLAGAGCTSEDRNSPPPQPSPSHPEPLKVLQQRYHVDQAQDPPRTLLRSDDALVATLTHGARTVVVRGRQRTFTERATTEASVRTRDWVHIAERAFAGELTDSWASYLLGLIGTDTHDVLATSLQYLAGTPELRDANGVRYAGDAGFGFLNTDEIRDGADFYDFLGVPWRFPDHDKIRRPSTRWKRQLDCSGYLRIVYGYRHGITLYHGNGAVDGLPRSAWAMADHAPSVVIASTARSDRAPKDLSRLQPGDAVFFALHDERPGDISHSGICLGPDGEDRIRFVSSRGTINGPSFGDVAGDGVIDDGYFGLRLRRAIRF
jgi:hypothetical protein